MKSYTVVASMLALTLGACSAAGPAPSANSADATEGTAGKVAVQLLSGPDDPLLDSSSIKKGTFRIHAIDVGTGLSVLVQGADFTMLFDAGSNDDISDLSVNPAKNKNGNNNRVLNYLEKAMGPSGPAECRAMGEPMRAALPRLAIDHLFLSHPHEDHDSLMQSVIECYEIKEFWEPGVNYASQGYLDLVNAVYAEKDTLYHTVVNGPTSGARQILPGKDGAISWSRSPKSWTSFAAGEKGTLGVGADFKILYTDDTPHLADVNQNSIVVRLNLGKTSVLLMGDAQAGARAAPEQGSVKQTEEILMKSPDLKGISIMQIAHHGSSTSSRAPFLQAINPTYAFFSAGPKSYGTDPMTKEKIVLPDQSVVDFLNAFPSLQVKTNPGEKLPPAEVGGVTKTRVARLFRTDARDAKTVDAGSCAERIGEDHGPGGCDNYVFELSDK